MRDNSIIVNKIIDLASSFLERLKLFIYLLFNTDLRTVLSFIKDWNLHTERVARTYRNGDLSIILSLDDTRDYLELTIKDSFTTITDRAKYEKPKVVKNRDFDNAQFCHLELIKALQKNNPRFTFAIRNGQNILVYFDHPIFIKKFNIQGGSYRLLEMFPFYIKNQRIKYILNR